MDSFRYSRRNFLYLASTLFPLAKLALAKTTGPDFVGQLGTLYYIKEKMDGKTSTFSFTLYNLDNNDYFDIPLNFKAHSISLNLQKQQAFLSGKWLPQACTLDLKNKKIIKDISLPEGRIFNGHGLYLEEEEAFMSSEQIISSDKNTKIGPFQGRITIRDTKNLQIKREFPSFGDLPHTIDYWDSNKKIIAVCNDDREKANLAFIHCESGELIKKVPTSELSPGHATLAPPLLLYVGKWSPKKMTSEPPIGIYREDKRNKPEVLDIELPLKSNQEVFWVVLNKEQTFLSFIMTHDNIVYFFNLKNPKNKKYYYTNHPKGILLSRDGRFFILLETNRIRFFDSQTAEENNSMARIGDFISGHPYLA